MPVFRYFMFVGGALLALLLAADFVWPTAPVARAIATAGNDQPLIRIRSDRHLPDRVVLDTSQATVAAPVTMTAAVVPAQPQAQTDVLAEMSAKARVRETFAQFTPAQKADAATARRADVKTSARPQAEALGQVPQAEAPQIQPQPKRKVARAHQAPQQGRPMMLVAQQPHFGLFNTTW